MTADPEDWLVSIIDTAMGRKDGLLVVIETYFDESYGPGGTFCVAGYAFAKSDVGRFNVSWREMLVRYELPFFRMSACAHGRAPFDGLTKDQCIAAEIEAIDLIKDYALCGFAVTVNPEDYDRVVKNGKRHLAPSPYELCVWWIALQASIWATEAGADRIAFLFEAGDQNAGRALALLSKVAKHPAAKAILPNWSMTLVRKEEAPPCQAADLLAWQWFTDGKRQRRGEGRRKDLQRLVEARHNVMHADAAFLQDTMDGMRRAFAMPSGAASPARPS